MRVGIVGNGVVGVATARSYTEFCEVRVYDAVQTRRTHSLVQVLECDVIFICLPTPQKEGALECDLSAIKWFLSEQVGSKACLAIKSTVPIGATRGLREKYDLPNLVHSPEFLTARCSLIDAMLPSRNIIGFATSDPLKVPAMQDDSNPLSRLYSERFPHVPLLYMRSDESEAVKLIQNSFFAVKVAFWNEARSLGDVLGLDWQTVLIAILCDGRVDPSHTAVPGPDGKRGFGGTCLPKDIANLIHTMKGAGLTPHVTEAALTRNKTDREAT